MGKYIKKIIEYWNIYAPPLISCIIFWFQHWDAVKVSQVNQYIGMTISLTCLFTLIKSILFPNYKNDNKIEKIVTTQKSVKHANLIINQEENLEKNTKKIKKIMKGTTKMIKWIKLNKGVLIGWLISLVGILEMAFNVLADYLPYELPMNIVSIVITVVGIVVLGLTSQVGSAKFKEAMAQLKDQLDGDETDLTNISSVKYLERQIMIYEKSKLTLEKDLESLRKKYINVINDYQTCQQLALPVDEETANVYKEYILEYQKLQSQLNSKTSALQTYKAKLEQIKAQLN